MPPMRAEIYRDYADQHIVEVPCERLPGCAVGNFVARLHDAGLWHVVSAESEADGQVISEIGHGGPPTFDAAGKPMPSQHKYHVRVIEHKRSPMMAAMKPVESPVV